MRGEQPRGGEVQRAVGEEVEEGREVAGGPGDLDAVVGRVLGQAERSGAVDIEGAVALAEVEPAGVELGEVRDQLDGGLPLGSGQ